MGDWSHAHADAGKKGINDSEKSSYSIATVASSVGAGILAIDLIKGLKPNMQEQLLKGILVDGNQIDMKTLLGLSDNDKSKIAAKILKKNPELAIQIESAIGNQVKNAPLSQYGSKIKSRIGKIALHGASAIGGGAAGYFGTKYVYDNLLKRTIEGENTASPKIIKMKLGSVELFYGYLMYLVSLQKNVVGISAELDTAFANAVESLQEISDQLKKSSRGGR